MNKPGPLTAAEFARMKLHSSVGADILSAIDFPDPVVPIVRHHHENWDGSGYPDRIAGTNIPIGARILSVVDCFDALTSDRPYRPRLSDRDALRIIAERRGTMYDPLVVDTFERLHAEMAPTVTQTTQSVPLRTISEAAQSSDRDTHTRLLEEISASTEEMLTLFDLAKGLTSEMRLTDIADVIAKHLRRLIPCSACVLYIYDQATDELVAAHAVGDNVGFMAGVRLSLGERLSGWVAANRQTIRNSDAALDLGEAVRSIVPRLRSCLSTPLTMQGDLVGVLTLYSAGANHFSEEHQRIFEVIAHQVSPVIRHSADASRPGKGLGRDSVTGLHDIEQLRRLVETTHSERLLSPASILMVNIDSPSKLSRVQGREAADAALSRVVSKVRESLRASDLLFHYDVDRILAVLVRTERERATEIAARIAEAVNSEPVEAGPIFHVRVTVAAAPEDGSDLRAVIEESLRRLRAPVVAQGSDTSAQGSIH